MLLVNSGKYCGLFINRYCCLVRIYGVLGGLGYVLFMRHESLGNNWSMGG